MKGFRKFATPIATLLMICLLAVGCKTGTETESKKADKDKDYEIKLGYYNCDHMTAAVVAKDAGIFDKYDLKVKLTGNGQVPEAMAAGKMDVGYIGHEGLVRAREKGSPIFIAAGNHEGGSFYLIASNKIKDAKDLVGKTVALGADIEKTDSYWHRLCYYSGLPVEGKNYANYDMEIKDKFLALKTGQLDGYIT